VKVCGRKEKICALPECRTPSCGMEGAGLCLYCMRVEVHEGSEGWFMVFVERCIIVCAEGRDIHILVCSYSSQLM
jgi:hypothetical protein